MGTPLKAPADLTGADIFKVDTSKAKPEKKKKCAFMGTPAKIFTDLTGADIFKVDNKQS